MELMSIDVITLVNFMNIDTFFSQIIETALFLVQNIKSVKNQKCEMRIL